MQDHDNALRYISHLQEEQKQIMELQAQFLDMVGWPNLYEDGEFEKIEIEDDLTDGDEPKLSVIDEYMAVKAAMDPKKTVAKVADGKAKVAKTDPSPLREYI